MWLKSFEQNVHRPNALTLKNTNIYELLQFKYSFCMSNISGPKIHINHWLQANDWTVHGNLQHCVRNQGRISGNTIGQIYLKCHLNITSEENEIQKIIRTWSCSFPHTCANMVQWRTLPMHIMEKDRSHDKSGNASKIKESEHSVEDSWCQLILPLHMFVAQAWHSSLNPFQTIWTQFSIPERMSPISAWNERK